MEHAPPIPSNTIRPFRNENTVFEYGQGRIALGETCATKLIFMASYMLFPRIALGPSSFGGVTQLHKFCI